MTAAASLSQARNLNAALKKLLKIEGEKDDKTLRFIKGFRDLIKRIPNKGDSTPVIADFVARTMPEFKEHLLVVGRNAFFEQIEVVLTEVIEKYADDFNLTYDHDGSGEITISDEDRFLKLANEAVNRISELIKESTMPDNSFIKSSVLYALFDPTVLAELDKRL